MGETTAISWADATVNFWMGCTALSPACDGCYARALVQDRFGRTTWGGPGLGAGTRTRTSAATWALPFRLARKARRDGTRPFVFVNSLSDFFDNAVPAEWRRHAFDVMRATPELVYLLLTKRPQLIVRHAEEAGGLPPNYALGTTAEDQERADRNVPALLAAAVDLRPLFTFLSCEPLLGPIDISAHYLNPQGFVSVRKWVITGGETDQGAHKARPTHPDWFRSLRDQCAVDGVPFHHKQNGEWIDERVATSSGMAPGPDMFDRFGAPKGPRWHPYDASDRNGGAMIRVGKSRAGRLLDGVLHDARPAVPAMEASHG